MSELLTVHQALQQVMAEVGPVAKDGRVDERGMKYRFRGVDAVVNAVHGAIVKAGIIVAPVKTEPVYQSVTSKSGTAGTHCKILVTYRWFGPGGDWFDTQVAGESMDWGDKSTPKGMSVAYRTVLLQTLNLPTDDPDPDSEVFEHQATPAPAAASSVPPLPAEVAEARGTVGQLWAELTGTREPNVVTLAKAYADANAGADIWQAGAPALRQFAAALSAGGIEIPKAGTMASGAAPGTPEPDAAPPTDDPAESEPLGDGQRKAIFAALGKLGVRDDVESRYTLGTLAGRVLESRSDLTKADGRRISQQLRNVKTREQLEQVLAQAEQAAADGN